MVVRIKKKGRKYLGNRRWGAGNIKNRRGGGDRGGVGKAGRKHKQTYRVVYERAEMSHKGFYNYKKNPLNEINLGTVSKKVLQSSAEKPVIELPNFKVLSSGVLAKPAVIKASAFSKKAEEKIRQAGGEAIKI